MRQGSVAKLPSTAAISSESAIISSLALRKSYKEGHEILRGITLQVTRGEVVCVIGPSGSGKSTLLRCLALLERPSDGSITMHDRTISMRQPNRRVSHDARAVRPKIGMVFQSFNLWPHLTVLQNVTLGPKSVRKLSSDDAIRLGEQMLAKVGLSEKRDFYPTRLSGGQQQRVAIARALAMEPEVILFDEATSALDPELTQEVLDVMRDLARAGTTMVIVTHEMSFARDVGTRVVFIDDGVVVEEGDPCTFFSAPKTDRARRFLRKCMGP